YNIFVVSCVRGDNGGNSVEIFQPMWETVFRGLQSRDAECGYRVFLMATFHVDQNLRYPEEPKKGDVVILVGHESSTKFKEQCATIFSQRQVYCIWYFSEHDIQGKLNFTFPGLCEIWEYTRANSPFARVVRYIPAGFLPVESTVEGNDAMVAENVEHWKNLSAKDMKLNLQFVGSLSSARILCWEHLKTVKLFHTLMNVNVWGRDHYRALGRQKDTVFLNMHRHCNNGSMYPPGVTPPLETVRLSLMLSVGAVVISEQTNDADAAVFDGVVLFEPQLSQPSNTWATNLQKLLADPQEIARWQLQAYNRFKTKFSPKQIMLDANVWDGGFSAHGACR
ncbi:unnamed protein product, partial [Symbiodinium pilosum]